MSQPDFQIPEYLQELFEKITEPLNEKDKEFSFTTKEYGLKWTGAKKTRLSEEVVLCGNVKDLVEYYASFQEQYHLPDTDADLQYLADKIRNNVMLERRMQEAKDCGTVPAQREVTDDSVRFLDLKLRHNQTSANGCWSASMALLFRSRGVDIDERSIREYHGGVDMKTASRIMEHDRDGLEREREVKEKMADSEVRLPSFFTSVSILNDKAFSPDENADIFLNMFPNTGLRTRRVESGSKESFTGLLESSVRDGLQENASPVSVNVNGHYVTITGFWRNGAGETCVHVEDSLHSDIPDNNMTVSEFAEKYWRPQSSYSCTYLQDLTPNLDGTPADLSKTPFSNVCKFDKDGIFNRGNDSDCVFPNNKDLNTQGHTIVSSNFDTNTYSFVMDELYVPKKTDLAYAKRMQGPGGCFKDVGVVPVEPKKPKLKTMSFGKKLLSGLKLVFTFGAVNDFEKLRQENAPLQEEYDKKMQDYVEKKRISQRNYALCQKTVDTRRTVFGASKRFGEPESVGFSVEEKKAVADMSKQYKGMLKSDKVPNDVRNNLYVCVQELENHVNGKAEISPFNLRRLITAMIAEKLASESVRIPEASGRSVSVVDFVNQNRVKQSHYYSWEDHFFAGENADNFNRCAVTGGKVEPQFVKMLLDPEKRRIYIDGCAELYHKKQAALQQMKEKKVEAPSIAAVK